MLISIFKPVFLWCMNHNYIMVFATGNDMQLDEVQPESGALPGDSI